MHFSLIAPTSFSPDCITKMLARWRGQKFWRNCGFKNTEEIYGTKIKCWIMLLGHKTFAECTVQEDASKCWQYTWMSHYAGSIDTTSGCMSSYLHTEKRRRFVIPWCRLFLSFRSRIRQASNCSPANREHELGLDRRETS